MSRRLQELTRALGLPALALLAACDATLTVTRRRVSGPVAEVGLIEPGAGVTRWALKGPGWLVARRRAKAFRLAAGMCGGEALVRVTAEKDQELAETRYTEDDLDADKFVQRGHYKVETYRTMEFECVKP